MAAAEQNPERSSIVETVDEEGLYGPSEALLENIAAALSEGDIALVETLIEPLHPADVADLIEHLKPEERKLFLEITRHVLEPETISHLEESLRDEVVEQMRPEELASVVAELDSETAARDGQPLEVMFDMDKTHIFDPETEQALV